VRVHPSGAKAFLINYRAGNGGRKAPNKRVVVGRAGRATRTRRGALPRSFSGALLWARIPLESGRRRVPCLRWGGLQGLHGLGPRPEVKSEKLLDNWVGAALG